MTCEGHGFHQSSIADVMLFASNDLNRNSPTSVSVLMATKSRNLKSKTGSIFKCNHDSGTCLNEDKLRTSAQLPHFRIGQNCPGFTGGGKGIVGRIDDGQSDNKRALKKFFYRLKENIGLAERTEFSKTLSDAFDDLDKYKLCLDRLSESVCTVIQGNSAFRKMDRKTQIGLYEKQAVEHREYIRRARRALHSIRTFIQHDYWIIGIQRTELDNLRAEMDFAKSELKSAKDPQLVDLKNKVYNQAVHAFEGKLNEVTKLMDAVPKNKENHAADLIEWTNCTRVYHEKMAKLLEI
ncbi:unnamed protein product [Heligmosomoides polygyrus]|uniref:BAR domain-containing protein n=1 Tax=Heligmosomoides polygyrus TaxID=6339 RepID=A0A3P8DPS0_HELPZ|nr:unnamed protein product [Heligmosomoides polygyrus]